MSYSQITIHLSDLVSEKLKSSSIIIKPLKLPRIPHSRIPKLRKIKPMRSTVKNKMNKSFSDPQTKENLEQRLDSMSLESSPRLKVFQSKVEYVDQQDSSTKSEITDSSNESEITEQSKSDVEIPKDVGLKLLKTETTDHKISESDEVQKNQIKGKKLIVIQNTKNPIFSRF